MSGIFSKRSQRLSFRLLFASLIFLSVALFGLGLIDEGVSVEPGTATVPQALNFGFHVAQGDAEHMAAARAAGATFVVRVFKWADIEPVPGYRYWEAPDAALRAAQYHELEPDCPHRSSPCMGAGSILDGIPVIRLGQVAAPGRDVMLWAGIDRDGLWYALDRGRTWQRGGLAGLSVYRVVADPNTPGRLVAATDDGVYVVELEE